MKKSLLSLVALVFWAGVFGSVANALDIDAVISEDGPTVPTAYTQLLNEYSSDWWYTDDVTVKCDGADGTITIESPRVEDSIFEKAPWYYLFLSPYRVSKIKEWSAEVDNSRIIMRELDLDDSNAETATFKISSMDLDPNQAYYGFITPVDMYDVVWIPSKEICIRVNGNLCMQNFDCDGLDAIVNPIIVEPEQKPENPEDIKEPEANQEEVHGAACVGMDLAHVSHTTKGDKVTLTWTAVDGDTVDIAILNPEEGLYEKLATVKMADEKYVYTMKWNGEQNFMLTNNCGSVKYKADAAIEKTPEKIVTPATGPAENVLYIAIAAIILYGAYAIFFRKSDN